MKTATPPRLRSTRGLPSDCTERMISAPNIFSYQRAVASASGLRRWMWSYVKALIYLSFFNRARSPTLNWGRITRHGFMGAACLRLGGSPGVPSRCVPVPPPNAGASSPNAGVAHSGAHHWRAKRSNSPDWSEAEVQQLNRAQLGDR